MKYLKALLVMVVAVFTVGSAMAQPIHHPHHRHWHHRHWHRH